MFENFQEKSQENGPLIEKWQDKKSKRTRQKNERGDRKEESNDSPEIPDRGWGRTSDIPGLCSGAVSNISSVAIYSLQIEAATDSPWNASDYAALTFNLLLQIFHIVHHQLESTFCDSTWFSGSEKDKRKHKVCQYCIHVTVRYGFHKAGSSRFFYSNF